MNEITEALDMAVELIQEAKGADGPNGGFVTDHLDAAEGWLDKVREAMSAAKPVEGDAVELLSLLRQARSNVQAAKGLSALSQIDEAIEIVVALAKPSVKADGERVKVAFWASLTNANAGMRWLDPDSMEEMIDAAWVGFADPLAAALNPVPSSDEEGAK